MCPFAGDTPLELTDDCSLALVWKNNERLKEFVLVESKELECVEDPSSASEAARAGHFTLEQCLNLFTKPKSWPQRKRGEEGDVAGSSPRAQAAAGVSRELPGPA